MKSTTRIAIAATAFISLATQAVAHPGHVDPLGLAHGLMHPLSGLDHILAMIAVGLYAAQLGGRGVWMLPTAFLTAMIAGGAMGYAGIPIPMVEQGIALSVIMMGAAIALSLKMPVVLGMSLAAVFAIFHGHAHGSEGAATALFLPYAAGFIAATFLLHATGVAIGSGLNRFKAGHALALRRAAGTAGALAGLAIMLS